MKPLSVAVAVKRIGFSEGVGGLERAAALHATMLQSLGATVHIFHPVGALSGEPPQGVHSHPIPWPLALSRGGQPLYGVAYQRWNRRLGRRLAKDAATLDVWHFHGATVGALHEVSARSRSHPVRVVNPHGMEEFGPLTVRTSVTRPWLRYESRASQMADRIIASDPSLIPSVLDNLGVDADRIALVPNVVDLARLDELAGQGPSCRRRTFLFVTVGRVVPNKGYDLWLQTLISLSRSGSLPHDWEWLHFGNGASLDSIRQEARAVFGERCRFVTDASDAVVQATLADADLFVQPSRYEGSSLTTLEGMAHGRLVLATRVGGIPDKIAHGVTGLLAQDPTVESLEAGVNAALRLKDPARIGSQARAWVRAERSVEESARLYADLYASLLSMRDEDGGLDGARIHLRGAS